MIKNHDPLPALRLQVRALWCAALVFACVAAARVRTVHVSNADNTPDTTISLSSSNWTGTLDAACLSADPVVGRDVFPASIDASGNIQAGGYFATRSANFAAGDFGIYLFGNQIANGNGSLFARNYLSTPTAYIGTVRFPDGSGLTVAGHQLVWIDPHGDSHTVTTTP